MTDSLHIVCAQCNSTNRVPRSRLAHNPKCGVCKNLLFNARPLILTGHNFRKHITHNTVPVVVDFWAGWCGPCKMMAPDFEEAAVRLEPYILLAKVNTETEQGLAAQFNIRGIPTIVIFREGVEIARQSGAMDLSNLLAWIQANV